MHRNYFRITMAMCHLTAVLISESHGQLRTILTYNPILSFVIKYVWNKI